MTYTAGPFNGPHVYVQWGGTLPGGEIWSNGLRMAPAAGAGAPVYDPAVHIAVTSAIEAFHGRNTSFISPRALMTFCKMNVIGTDGKYTEAVTHEIAAANLPGGGNVDSTPANQVALAISWTTAVSRGPAHRGRFYMPLPCIVPAADGLIANGDALNVKASATTLLTALNGVSAAIKVAVMSRKAGNPGSRFVTGIQVGRALDTQRRRRNALAETYA